MKKILFITAILLLSISIQNAEANLGSEQELSEGYVIKGTLKGKSQGAKVRLLDLTDETKMPVAIDSAIVKKGSFQFSGKIPEPAMYMIYIELPDDKLPVEERNLASKVYIENKKMTFDADIATMPSYYYAPDRNTVPAVITGSASQKLNEELQSQLSETSNRLAVLDKRYLAEYHIPSLEGQDLSEIGISLQNEIDDLKEQRKSIILDFIRQYPSSPVAFDQVSYLCWGGDKTVAQYDELLSIIEPDWGSNKRFEQLKKRVDISKNMAIGEKLPDAEFFKENGDKVMLSSLLPKEKYTLVEFWASWCGPCRGEIPHLKKLKAKYPEFNIVSLSIDDSDSKWKKALEEEGMNWTQINYKQGFDGIISSLYGIQGVPAGFVVDGEGKIIASDMRGAPLDKLLLHLYAR